MKRPTIRMLAILIVAAIFLCVPVGTAAQTVTVRGRFSQPGISRAESVHDALTAFSRVTWYFRQASPSVCSFKIEQSPLGVTWTDLTELQDCSSEGELEFITSVIERFLRVNMVAYTGTGVTSVLWEGFTGQKCGKEYNGIFSTIVSPDPAAGAEVSVAVPSNERWRVYSASVKLQANSVAADREVFLTASENGNEYFRTFADGVVKANQEGVFTAANLGFVGTVGLGPSAINQSNDVRTLQIPIYSEVFIPGGHVLATDTNNLQSGDDYSSAVVLVERCPN